MKKRHQPIRVAAPKVRDPYALHAKMRRAEKFADRRSKRGGSTNWRHTEED